MCNCNCQKCKDKKKPAKPKIIVLSDKAFNGLVSLLNNPPKASENLKKLMKQFKENEPSH